MEGRRGLPTASGTGKGTGKGTGNSSSSTGKSKEEEEREAAQARARKAAREEYLRRYLDPLPSPTSTNGSSSGKKKKRRKRQPATGGGGGLQIVDIDERSTIAAPVPARDGVSSARTNETVPASPGEEEEAEEDRPVLVITQSQPELAIPRGRKDNWITVDGPPTAALSRKRHDSPTSSPPRKRHDSPTSSPPRKRHDSPTSSPPRKRHDSPSSSPPRKRHDSPRSQNVPSTEPSNKGKLSSGITAGLHSAKQMRLEASRVKKEKDERWNKADPRELGHGAETVYRDRKGRKLEMLHELINADKDKPQDEPQMEWGVGLVQRKQTEDAKQRELDEQNKPFARAPDDAELDEHYRGIDRWGDPMMALLNKEGSSKEKTLDKRGKHKKRKKERKVCKYRPTPNRFNILPGPHWDGVDRSSGFEKKYFERESSAIATARDAYAWSVEDM